MMRCVAAGLLAALSFAAQAQDLRELLRSTATPVPPLAFKPEVGELGMFSSIPNAVFKPAGAGPFPIVVVGHTCGGVTRPHIKERMRELLDAGFAVLALDSFGPRGVENCRGQSKVRSANTVMDAYQALAHLDKVPDIDKSRIYFAGYSWGAMAAVMLASPQSAEASGSTLRYRATVSHYGGCSIETRAGSVKLLWPDVDRPLLMLMASEDKEFKNADCFPVLDEMKAAGKPLTWHIYADTHHAWDQADQRGLYKVRTASGEENVYKYSAEATKDSTARMIAFFNANR